MLQPGAEAVSAAGLLSGCDDAALTGIFSLPPAQLSLLSSLLGFLFIDGLDLDQQNALGNFIVGIGQTILTAAAQGQLIQSASDPTTQMQKQIQRLKKQVDALERKVKSGMM